MERATDHHRDTTAIAREKQLSRRGSTRANCLFRSEYHSCFLFVIVNKPMDDETVATAVDR